MGSNQGADTSPTTECVGTRAGTTTTPANSLSTTFLKASRQPKDNEKGSEENKQFDPGGEGEKPPPWNATKNSIAFLFSGGHVGPWDARCLCFVFFVCVCLPVCSLFIVLSGDHFFSELKNMTQPEGKHFLAHQPLEDGDDQQYPVRS